MKVNDIVAIKNGGKLIALVQVIVELMKSMMMKVKPIGLFSDALFVYWIGTFGENTTSAKKNISYLF